MTQRYGVQYQHLSSVIEAGSVRNDPANDREVFIMKSDVTGQCIGATALWLIAHADELPYQITDRHGVTYELTSRVVPAEEVYGR